MTRCCYNLILNKLRERGEKRDWSAIDTLERRVVVILSFLSVGMQYRI